MKFSAPYAAKKVSRCPRIACMSWSGVTRPRRVNVRSITTCNTNMIDRTLSCSRCRRVPTRLKNTMKTGTSVRSSLAEEANESVFLCFATALGLKRCCTRGTFFGNVQCFAYAPMSAQVTRPCPVPLLSEFTRRPSSESNRPGKHNYFTIQPWQTKTIPPTK